METTAKGMGFVEGADPTQFEKTEKPLDQQNIIERIKGLSAFKKENPFEKPMIPLEWGESLVNVIKAATVIINSRENETSWNNLLKSGLEVPK